MQTQRVRSTSSIAKVALASLGLALAVLAATAAGRTLADSTARPGATPTPAAICWDIRAEAHAPQRRPKHCGLYPPDTVDGPPFGEHLGHYLFGLSWSRWGRSEAIGRGSAYRLWSNTVVRLFAPEVECGRLVFTRARFRYVGSTGKDYFVPNTVRLACR